MFNSFQSTEIPVSRILTHVFLSVAAAISFLVVATVMLHSHAPRMGPFRVLGSRYVCSCVLEFGSNMNAKNTLFCILFAHSV